VSADGGFSINLTKCTEAHGAINSVISDLNRMLSELESKAAPLISTWDGQAQQAYLAKQKRWEQDSAEITRILQAINRALEDSIADYRSAERYGVNLFTR
jgi:early secretory antigenic target protein ESAT-6